MKRPIPMTGQVTDSVALKREHEAWLFHMNLAKAETNFTIGYCREMCGDTSLTDWVQGVEALLVHIIRSYEDSWAGGEQFLAKVQSYTDKGTRDPSFITEECKEAFPDFVKVHKTVVQSIFDHNYSEWYGNNLLEDLTNHLWCIRWKPRLELITSQETRDQILERLKAFYDTSNVVNIADYLKEKGLTFPQES